VPPLLYHGRVFLGGGFLAVLPTVSRGLAAMYGIWEKLCVFYGCAPCMFSSLAGTLSIVVLTRL